MKEVLILITRILNEEDYDQNDPDISDEYKENWEEFEDCSNSPFKILNKIGRNRHNNY